MPQYPAIIDLSTLDGSNGFKISGDTSRGYSGTSVASADVNGDGFADLIVGAPAVFLYSRSADPGSAYVVYGKAGGFDANLHVSTLDGSNGFKLDGASARSAAGFSVASAGDVNGDGFEDVIVGAHHYYPGGNNYGYGGYGASYVVFGKAEGFDANIDLPALDGTDGFVIDKPGAYIQLGVSVASAGDVNGDGFDDVVVGSGSNQSYVVFGKAGGFDASLDVSTLDGANGFTLGGAPSGTSVASAGDINGDGIDDLTIGGSSIASYVVFGPTGGFGANVDLSSLDGSNGFKITGTGFTGKVASAGDVNGDGIADLIAGRYVVFGTTGGFGASVDVSTLDGSNGFKLAGEEQSSVRVVASAGDVNGDGFDDLIVGTPGLGYAYGSSQGPTYVVFGKASGFNATIDLSSLDGTDGFKIVGAQEYSRSGWSVASAGDINGDGFADLIIGAPNTDTGFAYGNPNLSYSGQSYVVFGRAPDTAVNRTGTDASQTLAGGAFNDVLHGLGGDDQLYGNGGDDQLFGGVGNDALRGGVGADFMTGGAGDDIYCVDSSGDVVHEAPNGGADAVHTAVSYALAANVEILISDSDAGLTLQGNILDNTIIGGAGDDRLNGRTGADHMDGGAGDDFYLVDNIGDTITDSAGNDLVRTSVDYTLGDGIERLHAGSDTGLILNGNDLDNQIIGGGGNDHLLGGLGRDILAGNDGDDTFVYQSTADSGTTDTTRDTINDFNTGDAIDLSAIDAISGGTHDDFTFIGNGDFTAAGQVRWETTSGGDTVVQVNTGGSFGPDMSILLRGDHSLTVDDFKLS